jgi:hypothetical protein
MEEEIIVATQNVQIAFVKTDPELIKKLTTRLVAERGEGCIDPTTKEPYKNPYRDESQVKRLMRYNAWSVDQFCDVSGLSVSTITNLTRPVIDGEGKLIIKLDVCFPFADSGGKGLKLIIRNQKSEKFIKV